MTRPPTRSPLAAVPKKTHVTVRWSAPSKRFSFPTTVVTLLVTVGIVFGGSSFLWSKPANVEPYSTSDAPLPENVPQPALVDSSPPATTSTPEETPPAIPPIFKDTQEAPAAAAVAATPSDEATEAPSEPVTTTVSEPAVSVPTTEIPTHPDVSQEAVEAGAPVVVKPPRQYKVWIWQERGDCLWRIAERVYKDRSKWNIIYLANRDVIRDPNKIYPKQKLKIPDPDWHP